MSSGIFRKPYRDDGQEEGRATTGGLPLPVATITGRIGAGPPCLPSMGECPRASVRKARGATRITWGRLLSVASLV